MKNIFIVLGAIVLFVGGGALVYNAATEKPEPEPILYPEMTLPESEVMIPVSSTDKKGKRTYVADSMEQCAVIRFVCDEGEAYFGDDTGCGCEIVEERAATLPEYLADNGAILFNQKVTLSPVSEYYLPNGDLFAIDEMVNEPCAGVCVWSGLAVYYAWTPAGGARVRLPSYENFPYQLEQVDTDYETFVTIRLSEKE